MTADERANILQSIVDLDGEIIDATAKLARSANDLEFERTLGEVRLLRMQRAEYQSRLNAPQ